MRHKTKGRKKHLVSTCPSRTFIKRNEKPSPWNLHASEMKSLLRRNCCFGTSKSKHSCDVYVLT